MRCRPVWAVLLGAPMTLSAAAAAPVEGRALREELGGKIASAITGYRLWDAMHRDGIGQSDAKTSGGLGWGESSFLRDYMTNRRKKARVIVRKRLFYPGGGRGTALTIVDGLPVHKSGRKVCHPNGKAWTRPETAAEVAQLAYKAPPEEQP